MVIMSYNVRGSNDFFELLSSFKRHGFLGRKVIFTHSTKSFFRPTKSFFRPFKHLSPPFPLHSTTKTTCTLQKQQPRRNNNVIEILEERGLVDSITSDELRAACSTPLKVYCGFDPTAESLHLGNLLGIIVLIWFRRSGHRVVALIHGGTASIELDTDSLERNQLGISNTIERILGGAQHSNLVGPDSDFDSSVVILNNYDWWKEFSWFDFLMRVGKFARVESMVAKESVRKRLDSEQDMSFTEL